MKSQPIDIINDMAQVILSQSRMMNRILNQHMTSRTSNMMTGTDMIEMRGGFTKSKADIIRTLKRWMTAEMHRIPWINVLHLELGKAIEDQ